MRRLIDANAIYDAVERRYKVSSGTEHRCERDLLDLICAADTVHAVEAVHAEWQDGYAVRGGKKVYDSIDCSNCGDYFKIESHDREYWKKRFKVCPFCGAVMDGERKDNESDCL